MTSTLHLSHFIDHGQVLGLVDEFSGARLYIEALDRMYSETRDHIEQVIEDKSLRGLTLKDAVPLLVEHLDGEVARLIRDAGHLQGCFFALVGSELLWRGHRSGELEFWKASSHLNALNRLAKMASKGYGTGDSGDSRAALIRAYAIAERCAFIDHNFQVCEARNFEVTLEDLVRTPVEPDDFETHWASIAASFHMYSEYTLCGPHAKAIDAEITRRGERPFRVLNELLLGTLGFGLEHISTLLRVLDLSRKDGAVLVPLNGVFFDAIRGGKAGMEAVVSQFTWRVGVDQRTWDISFRPFLGVLVGGEPNYFAAPLAGEAAVTSFFNVVRQNAYIGRYVDSALVDEFAKKNASMQQHSSDELCFHVADVLTAHGLVTPLSGGVPRVNIKSFKLDGRKYRVGTDRDIGDIDVLAGDGARREIIVLECKLYRVGLTPKEFVDIDADKAQEALQRVRVRHEWAKEHVDELASLLGLSSARNVRSLVITARPNFMASQIRDDGIDMLDFAGLIRRFPANSR